MTPTQHAPKVVASSAGHSIAYGSIELAIQCDCGWTHDLDTETDVYALIAIVKAHTTSVPADDDHPDLAHFPDIECAECEQPITGVPVVNPDGPDPFVWCSEDCMAKAGERQQAGAR